MLSLREILRTAGEWVRERMTRSRGIEPVQAGLRDDDRPVGMFAARLLQGLDDDVLGRVRHLHHDQHQVRLVLAPGDIARWIVACLAEPARIEEAQQRCLGRHVVEA